MSFLVLVYFGRGVCFVFVVFNTFFLIAWPLFEYHSCILTTLENFLVILSSTLGFSLPAYQVAGNLEGLSVRHNAARWKSCICCNRRSSQAFSIPNWDRIKLLEYLLSRIAWVHTLSWMRTSACKPFGLSGLPMWVFEQYLTQCHFGHDLRSLSGSAVEMRNKLSLSRTPTLSLCKSIQSQQAVVATLISVRREHPPVPRPCR